MVVTVEIINGLAFGIEHVPGDAEDDFNWMIAAHILCFRICFYKIIVA